MDRVLSAEKRRQDQGKKSPQMVEDEPEVVAGGVKERIDSVTEISGQVVLSQPAFRLRFADGCLNGASPTNGIRAY